MDFSNFWWQAAEAPAPTGIGDSLRFRGAQSLSRTGLNTAIGDWTVSFWFKTATDQDSNNPVLFSGKTAGTGIENGRFAHWGDSSLRFLDASPTARWVQTSSLYRDTSAWYHCVVQRDDTSNTLRIFVNGEETPYDLQQDQVGEELFDQGTLNIGVDPRDNVFFEGYMADFYLVDGQAVDPTAFGAYDANGVWTPREIDFNGVWGANGFFLDFSDPADIGADRSGNGNDFTPTGFELADQTSSNWDHMQDSPTQNWATLNYLDNTDHTLSDANLSQAGSTSGYGLTRATIAPGSNKFYWEVVPTSLSGSAQIGIVSAEESFNSSSQVGGLAKGYSYNSNGNKLQSGVNASYGASYAIDDVIGVLLDLDNKQLEFYKNGVSQGIAFTGLSGSFSPANSDNSGGSSSEFISNFGQRPFAFDPPAGFKALQTQNLPEAPIPNGRDHFQAITGPGSGADLTDPGAGNWSQDMTITVGTQVTSEPLTRCFDGNTGTTGSCNAVGGLAEMTFAPDPAITGVTSIEIRRAGGTGYEAVFNGATSNLSNETGWNPVNLNGGNEISADTPLVLRRTNGSALAVSAIRVNGNILIDLSILALAQQTFPNGLWWIKDRANSNQHQLVDSVRGGNLSLQCPTVGAETAYVAPAGGSVAWCWKADGATVTNNDGDIVAQVAANSTAGFSIVTYSGNAAATASVGHGLNSEPEFVIVKARNAAKYWTAYHAAACKGVAKIIELNTSSALQDGAFFGAAQAFDNTVFTVGNHDPGASNSTNLSGTNYVAYCWHSVPGYSAFGSYTGNGDATDGPFIYLGFRPAFILVKNTVNSSAHWRIWDSTRITVNPVVFPLFPSANFSEGGPTEDIDFLSNGFKVRTNNSAENESGSQIIYAAFAELPTGGNNVSPANAR